MPKANCFAYFYAQKASIMFYIILAILFYLKFFYLLSNISCVCVCYSLNGFSIHIFFPFLVHHYFVLYTNQFYFATTLCSMLTRTIISSCFSPFSMLLLNLKIKNYSNRISVPLQVMYTFLNYLLVFLLFLLNFVITNRKFYIFFFSL